MLCKISSLQIYTLKFRNNKMSVEWNLNNSITFLLPNTSLFLFSKMIALHQNVVNCQNTLIVLTLRWRIFAQDVWMSLMCLTNTGTTQDYFILPAPPVGGLPISQDRLDRMKLVHDHTIPIILPSGKNILGNMVFQISVGYTNLDTMQIQSSLPFHCP